MNYRDNLPSPKPTKWKDLYNKEEDHAYPEYTLPLLVIAFILLVFLFLIIINANQLHQSVNNPL